MAPLAIAGETPLRQTLFPRWPAWDRGEIEAVKAVVERGRWGANQGTEVCDFEAEFVAYHTWERTTFGFMSARKRARLRRARIERTFRGRD